MKKKRSLGTGQGAASTQSGRNSTEFPCRFALGCLPSTVPTPASQGATRPAARPAPQARTTRLPCSPSDDSPSPGGPAVPLPHEPVALTCNHGLRRQTIVQSLLADVFQGRLRAGGRLVTRELAERF